MRNVLQEPHKLEKQNRVLDAQIKALVHLVLQQSTRQLT
jgi:hypothetical protein